MFSSVIAVIIAASLSGSAPAIEPSCVAGWEGRWALTAQGAPYSILDIGADESINVTREAVTGTLAQLASEGELVTRTIRIESRDEAALTIIIDRPGGPSKFHLTRAVPGALGAMLVDLPGEFRSPLFALIAVGPTVEPVTFPAPRSLDLLDDRDRDPMNNPEMTVMFEADQAIRREFSERGFYEARQDSEFMIRLVNGDSARQARTKELLEQGRLSTGDDYYHAAFIFQHGVDPQSYLRAHNAAMIAMVLGKRDAAWIASAALDRYLLSIDQQQIYGTQFRDGDMAPLDANVVSDADRAALGVPPLKPESD